MKSYFMAVKGYRCRGFPILSNIASWIILPRVSLSPRFFRHESSTNLIYLRIMAKECRRRIRRFSYVAISEINLMRFFCRGEIRRGKISRDIAREFLSCSDLFDQFLLRYITLRCKCRRDRNIFLNFLN